MIQLAIITISIFLTIFCRYETGSMELAWWEAYVSSLTMVALFILWLMKPSLFKIGKEKTFKNCMFVLALTGVSSIFFFSKTNSSIYAMCITLSFPSIIMFWDSDKLYIKVLVTAALLACCIAVIYSSSRTGMISIAVSLLYIICIVFKFRYKKVLLTGVLIIGTFAAILLFVKKDSSVGRGFILENTARMLLDKPLGWGKGGFEANYMLYQSNYFTNNTDERAAMLADDIKHPLNEYMYIATNYGIHVLLIILGIIAFILVTLYKINNRESWCFIHFIALLLVWGMFSYPCSISFVAVMLLVYIPFVPRMETLLFKNWIIRYSLILFFVIYGGTQLFAMNNERRWNWAIKDYRNGEKESAMAVFDKYANYSIGNAAKLFSLATIEYNNKDYARCIEVCSECKLYMASYELELMLANCYSFACENEKALTHFSQAHYMCPNRFVPLYKQFKIYNELGDTAKLKEVGNEILTKKIKVPSRKIDIILNNVKYVLKNMQ